MRTLREGRASGFQGQYISVRGPWDHASGTFSAREYTSGTTLWRDNLNLFKKVIKKSIKYIMCV